MDCPRVRYPQFNDQVEAELAAAGCQVLAGPGDQVDKVVQLYEVLMTRHTVMVVGQTGGGKSVILNTLARAQTTLGRRTQLHVLNPKAITVAELYGVLDKDTRDWTDGLLSNVFRWAGPGQALVGSGCDCQRRTLGTSEGTNRRQPGDWYQTQYAGMLKL